MYIGASGKVHTNDFSTTDSGVVRSRTIGFSKLYMSGHDSRKIRTNVELNDCPSEAIQTHIAKQLNISVW